MTVAYVTMPGTSGNYVSGADTNLLNADYAHAEQGVGTQSAYRCTFALEPSADAEFGSNVRKMTATLTGTDVMSCGSYSYVAGEAIPVTAGTTYSVRVRAKGDSGNPYNLDSSVRVRWYNAANGLISTSAFATGDDLSDSWVVLSGSAAAPALATQAVLSIWFFEANTGAGTDVGDVAYIDTVCFRAGAVTSFVPSLRIVGDLDMRARMTATDATPATAETLIGQRSGNSGYAMTLGTGGELVVYHGTGSGTRAETSSGLSLVAATDTEVRSVIDISAGTWTHYKNGVQFDTSGSFATTAGSPFAGPLAVGADSAGTSGNWDGDIYYCEVRDGIDGPVVRRFDADDLIGLV